MADATTTQGEGPDIMEKLVTMARRCRDIESVSVEIRLPDGQMITQSVYFFSPEDRLPRDE